VKIFYISECKCKHGSRGSSVVIGLAYGLDYRGVGVRFLTGQYMFLFSITSSSALGYIQRSIQRVPGAVSPTAKATGA
jgi:hypothetical protein